ncbi:MAG: ABC transporter substrate-binding protein [Gammaproteobacteria bacterium]|nr:ABC transporter substrate-binding protein [Gammaproteobacteria bacterium]MBU2256692.1 ABC transporter substrate-binding protein [Gammaproteobacteria bacterium]
MANCYGFTDILCVPFRRHGVFRSVLAVIYAVCLLAFGLVLPAVAENSRAAVKAPASVVFLNPGFSDEPFWVGYSDFMQAAADDLGMQLQVIYGERNPPQLLEKARSVLARDKQPDYLIFVNEMYTAPELLRLFADSPIKLFSLHSTLTPEQQQIIGGSRGQYRNWIGSLIPNDEQAGYWMAKALIAKLKGKPGSLLAFAGVRFTPSSSLREEGLHRALREHPEIKLQQMLQGEWKRQRAYEQARLMLPRHPEVQLVWSANDEMAFGVMQAAQELGKQPGKDIYLSALNNSDEVLQARIDGKLCVLVGGHFTLGGWAMVMLHDYHAGVDFAARGGKDRVDQLFSLLDAKQAAYLKKRLKVPGYGLDFRQFSAVYRPQIKDYGFSIKPLLQ